MYITLTVKLSREIYYALVKLHQQITTSTFTATITFNNKHQYYLLDRKYDLRGQFNIKVRKCLQARLLANSQKVKF